jgi:transcriptional regulator with XRE-family HTH domain
MARAALQIGVSELASLADVSAQTVTQFESEKSQSDDDTIQRLQRALEAAGVEFTNGGQPGVRMTRAAVGSGKKPSAINDEAALPEIPEEDGEPYDGAPI